MITQILQYGQQLMARSLSVAIASDHAPISVNSRSQLILRP